MAAFPTLPHTVDSTRAPDGGQAVDYAEDGTPRVRSLYAAARWRFDLRLYLDATQLAALLAHYADEGTAAFSYTWPEDSTAYSVRYVAYPQTSRAGRADLYRVSVELEGQAA